MTGAAIAASRFADVDGRPAHYLEAGAGPALVLLHGGGPQTDAEFTWRPVLAELARDFHVIAPDLAGFGQTPPADDWSMLGRARHAGALLDALGLDDVALAGHSQGGFVATRLAIEHPHRVRSLTIISSGTTAPGGVIDADGRFSPALRATLAWRRDPTFEGFCDTNRMLCHRPERMPTDELRGLYDRMLERGLLEVEAERSRRTGAGRPEHYRRLHDEHVRPFVDRLTMPTLVVWGREDDFAPPAPGIELARMLPVADMVVLGGCKHQVMRDRPEALVRELVALQRPD